MEIKTVVVPQILREVKNYKSVAEKVEFLSCIKGHPLHSFIIEGITMYCAAACNGRISDKTMISNIDEMCKLFANKFKK